VIERLDAMLARRPRRRPNQCNCYHLSTLRNLPMSNRELSRAEQLNSVPPEERTTFLGALTGDESAALEWDWTFLGASKPIAAVRRLDMEGMPNRNSGQDY
jgi:hypothetical protein